MNLKKKSSRKPLSPKDISRINFEKNLSKGPKSYEKEVGEWWTSQSGNRAHRIAYHNIARELKKQLGRRSQGPLKILDYACGEGSFMEVLFEYFPKAQIYGLDGSRLMLSKARQKIEAKGIPVTEDTKGKKRIPQPGSSLIFSYLPNFNLLKGKMDVVTFLFPNLTCGDNQAAIYNKHGFKYTPDTDIAEMLARFREMDPEDEVEPNDPEEQYDDLMTSRVISRNLRLFLKPKGVAMRTDYANAPRDELSQLTRWRTLFSEGALEQPIKNKDPKVFFKLLSSRYFKSSVILDVYHQTGDPDDMEGGYFCSLFQAV